MTAACAFLLGNIFLYRTASYNELRSLRKLHLQVIHQAPLPRQEPSLNAKQQLRQLQQRLYRLDYQILAILAALLIFMTSVLALGLSIVVPLTLLTKIARWLFVLGSGSLVLIVLANLIQLWRDHCFLRADLSHSLDPLRGIDYRHQKPNRSKSMKLLKESSDWRSTQAFF
jgi:hypothetical protein